MRRVPLAGSGVSQRRCAERRSAPRPLGGAPSPSTAPRPGGFPARTRVSSASPAPGGRPPRSRTLTYQVRIVYRIFFSWGVLVSQPDKGGKRERSGTLPGYPNSGRSLPRAFRPGRCPSVRSAQGQSCGVQPPPLAPVGPDPQPQLGFRRRPLPALCQSAAQRSSDPFQDTRGHG